ncbi:hypothetical protein [Bradyrhizobium macuxiense]|nr:hypothetical protein [Bradyrhizobium macuxiense]
MNDTENETVRFSMKPNPFFYALEFTLHALFAGTTRALIISFFPFMGLPFIWPGLYSEKGGILLLAAYALFGLSLFIVAVVTSYYLTFIATDKTAIVRFSFWGMTTDGLSIAIETVERIEIKSHGATYGSVYLNSPSRHPRSEATRVPILIERNNSRWRSMTTWPRLLGFYGFKGFNEFADIISEQRNSVSDVKGTMMPVPSFLIK